MLKKEALKHFKKDNASADTEKVKQRLHALWSAASPKQKKEVKEFADVAQNTMSRARVTGILSTKMAVAFAQCLNVDPMYLVGETDETGDCTDENMGTFLKKHGYGNLADAGITPQKRTRRKPAAKAAESEHTETEEETRARFEAQLEKELAATRAAFLLERGLKDIVVTVAELPPEAIASFSGDSFLSLFTALEIKAEAGIPGANERLAMIKELLLS